MQVAAIGARDCLARGKGLSNFFGCLGLREYQILSQVLVIDNFAICRSKVYRLETYISSNYKPNCSSLTSSLAFVHLSQECT
jgi:hypothetical protein